MQNLVQDSDSLEERIILTLRNWLPQNGLFVTPDIPSGKLSNALRYCDVPPGERILGLIDCTVFGSAKQSLLFGSNAIYFHNGLGSKGPKTGTIPYVEFATCIFQHGGYREIALGNNCYLNISGSSVPKEKIISILQSVRQLMPGVPSTMKGDTDEITTPNTDVSPRGVPLGVVADQASVESITDLYVRGALIKLAQSSKAKRVHVAPNIDVKKMEAIRSAIDIPEQERILVVVETSSPGRSSHPLRSTGVCVTEEAIYYRPDGLKGSSQPMRVAFSDFIHFEIEHNGKLWINGKEISTHLSEKEALPITRFLSVIFSKSILEDSSYVATILSPARAPRFPQMCIGCLSQHATKQLEIRAHSKVFDLGSEQSIEQADAAVGPLFLGGILGFMRSTYLDAISPRKMNIVIPVCENCGSSKSWQQKTIGMGVPNTSLAGSTYFKCRLFLGSLIFSFRNRDYAEEFFKLNQDQAYPSLFDAFKDSISIVSDEQKDKLN